VTKKICLIAAPLTSHEEGKEDKIVSTPGALLGIDRG